MKRLRLYFNRFKINAMIEKHSGKSNLSRVFSALAFNLYEHRQKIKAWQQLRVIKHWQAYIELRLKQREKEANNKDTLDVQQIRKEET